MLVGRPIAADFTETLAQFLAYDSVYLQTAVTQNATTGLLTIGYGYQLLIGMKSKSGKTIYEVNPEADQRLRQDPYVFQSGDRASDIQSRPT